MAEPAEKREPRAALEPVEWHRIDPKLRPFVEALAAAIVADMKRNPVRK